MRNTVSWLPSGNCVYLVETLAAGPPGIEMSVDQSIALVRAEISTATRWIAVKCYADIHVPRGWIVDCLTFFFFFFWTRIAWHFFLIPPQWFILMTLVSSWFFLWHHQHVKAYSHILQNISTSYRRTQSSTDTRGCQTMNPCSHGDT